MMLFRMPDPIDEAFAEQPDEEFQRVRNWQLERLSHLGYAPGIAEMLVIDAWMCDEHCDLVHRIEDLLSRGATLDQAARIVVPAVEPDVQLAG